MQGLFAGPFIILVCEVEGKNDDINKTIRTKDGILLKLSKISKHYELIIVCSLTMLTMGLEAK